MKYKLSDICEYAKEKVDVSFLTKRHTFQLRICFLINLVS